MDNLINALIDQLMDRRLDIAQMFVRNLDLRPAQTKEALREQMVDLIKERPTLTTALQAFLDEYANAGRRRFYFSKGCDLNLNTYDAWQARTTDLRKDEPVTLAKVARQGEGDNLVLRFEFEQKREGKQPWPDVPATIYLPDGSRVEHTATRIFDRPVLSTAQVYPSSGTVVYAIAQQSGTTDYNPILISMWLQLGAVTGVTWPNKHPLQRLAQQLCAHPKVDATGEKRKTPNGSVQFNSDRQNRSVNHDRTLNSLRSSVPPNHPHMRLRCCWGTPRHPTLDNEMILWLNAQDGFINLRQDATPNDTDYVLRDIRRLL